MGKINAIAEQNSPSPLEQTQTPSHTLVLAGLFLGAGQAGFFDGIVLHQLLQWHHMFSSIETAVTVAGLELNTLGDGLFHLFDWVMVLIGIALLWHAAHRQLLSGRRFMGALLMGAGLFNVIEGLIDHQLLGIHHVKPGIHQFAFDMSFLGIGMAIAGMGWLLLRTD
ncbi:MAG TPA: DUF2243 domain-containing protein [Stenomitos sp.]